MPGANPEGAHCRGRCLHRPAGLALPRTAAGGPWPSPTNGFYARRRPGGCAYKQNKADAFQDGRRRSFYISAFSAQGRASPCRGAHASITTQGCANSRRGVWSAQGPHKSVQGRKQASPRRAVQIHTSLCKYAQGRAVSAGTGGRFRRCRRSGCRRGRGCPR